MAVTINASTTAGLVQTADTTGILQLQTAGTAVVTVNASQNVGIGTASPSTKLDVNGTAKATTVQATTLSDGTNSTSATNCIQGSAKAWVRYTTATGASVVNASYNVSSVTYNGTGDVTINFTSALTDGSYAFGAMGDDGGPSVIAVKSGVAPTSSALRLWMGKPNSSVNNGIAGVTIFR